MSKICYLQGSENYLQKKQHEFSGFDFLRAIFSIVVVAFHVNLFNLLSEKFGWFLLSDILTVNVGLIAVPVFFQVSLFLFFMKSEKVGLRYFAQKRLPKLISLYLFWGISLMLVRLLFRGQAEVAEVTEFEISSARKVVEFIISGGYSHLYFFFSLIFITLFAQLLVSLFRKVKKTSARRIICYCLLGVSGGFIFSFSILGLINHEVTIISTISKIVRWNYNPLNFLPYIFTAAIVIQEFNEGKLKRLTPLLKYKLWGLLSLFVAFTVLEWEFINDLNYARPSLIFGSWLLLYVAILSNHKPPAIVNFISDCSLGIYAFHLFFTHILFPDNFLSEISNMVPGLSIATEFLLALIGSIALTLVFKRIKGLKRFV